MHDRGERMRCIWRSSPEKADNVEVSWYVLLCLRHIAHSEQARSKTNVVESLL